MKKRFILCCALVLGFHYAHAQDWAWVKGEPVTVKSESPVVKRKLGKAKKGDVMWLRDGTPSDGQVAVWFEGQAGNVLEAGVELFKHSELNWEAFARSYKLVAPGAEEKVRATMEFVPRGDRLFMCLHWMEKGRGTETYEVGYDNVWLMTLRGYAGELPEDMSLYYQTAKSLQYANVFYYDAAKGAFFDGKFYFLPDTTVAPKDMACFDEVRNRKEKPWVEAGNPESGAGETNPEFPGGNEACIAFLARNIKYPPICIEEEVSGRVYVRFVVGKDGSIGQIHVLRSPNPYLSAEAMRVVGRMPKWKPGTVDGKPVRVLFSLPVLFRLR